MRYELPKRVCHDATNRSGVDNYRASMTSFYYIQKEWLARAAMIARADISPVPGTSMFLVPGKHRLHCDMPPTETDYKRYILARAGQLVAGSAQEFSSAMEDFHLVTLLPPIGPLEGYAHQKTGHFHFGSMCYCHKRSRYHHCIGQIAVKSLLLVKILSYLWQLAAKNLWLP